MYELKHLKIPERRKYGKFFMTLTWAEAQATKGKKETDIKIKIVS